MVIARRGNEYHSDSQSKSGLSAEKPVRRYFKTSKHLQMKNYLVQLAAIALVLTGCSTAFKTAEMPDDVYYSYGPQQTAGRESYTDNREEGYESYFDDADDRYLRMKVRNRDRWNQIDDLQYWYGMQPFANPWNWNCATCNTWNRPLSGSWMWNSGPFNTWANPFMVNPFFSSWNNPFLFNSMYNSWNNPWAWNRPVIIVDKYPAGSGIPRPSMNSGGYSNTIFDRGNTGSRVGSTKENPRLPAGYGNRELFRTIFSNGSSGSSRPSASGSDSWQRPSRMFDNSGSSSSPGSSRTSGSSSSSSSSSSSGGSSSGRGGRGGN